MNPNQLYDLLEWQFKYYNNPSFIENDPILIPHQFCKLQDIEIAGFFAATFAWGLRKTIINKSLELIALFDNAPHDFMINHTESDLKRLVNFKHRTFNATDLLFFVRFFRKYYSSHDSLECLFVPHPSDDNIKNGINNFYNKFIDDKYFPSRTKKHVASPDKNSTCKRINMFLRWMIRKDENGVDFGLWNRIKPSMLICPCDVHVEKVARQLGLLSRRQVDWLAAEELTNNLRSFDPDDPVKYDFALFGMGMNGFYK